MADGKTADQARRHRDRYSRAGESGRLEQQIAHTLVAHVYTGIDRVQIDSQCRYSGAIDIATEGREVMHFEVVSIFDSRKVEVRVSGVQCPRCSGAG